MSRVRPYHPAVTEPQRRFDTAVHELMHSVGGLVQCGLATKAMRDRGEEGLFNDAELAAIYLQRCPQLGQHLTAARLAYLDLVESEMPHLAEPQERSA